MSCLSRKPPAIDPAALAALEAQGFGPEVLAGAPRILLAEDDPGTVEVLHLHMRLVGLDCDFAHDGAVALALYQASRAEGRPYALLALDLAMPVLSGLAVAEAVRAGGDTQTPIVFVTADDSTFSRARAQMVGAAGYWIKPGAVIELPQRILQVLADALA